jgi:hypothetical protein
MILIGPALGAGDFRESHLYSKGRERPGRQRPGRA